MGEKTGISWTDHTFNPWIGCTKVSPGCAHCYAERMVEEFPQGKGEGAFRILTRTKTWGDPVRWNKAAAATGVRELVFTCSMSDFFHEGADAWRDEAWALIKATPNLEYQILTKRPERIDACLPADWGIDGYKNVWLGTSVENQKYADLRIPQLLAAPAKVHFLSCEPLLGSLDISKWLGDSFGKIGAQGRASPRMGQDGPVEGRSSGAHLANCDAPEGPARPSDSKPLRSGEGRARLGRLPSGKDDVGREPDLRPGAPACLVPLQGPDSGRLADQPYQRQQEGQSAREHGVGHGLGPASARRSRAQEGSDGPSMGAGQSHGQTNGRSGVGDSAASNPRRVADENRDGFQHQHAGGVEDRSPGAVGLAWIIVGGESGPNHRQMLTQWAIDIKAECDAAGVPFFGKQRSGSKNEIPLIIKGREWKAFPAGFEAGPRRAFVGGGQQQLEVVR